MVALMLTVCGPRSWAAPPAELGPQEGVVVLSHGDTLEGRVARVGERYHVWTSGGEIRVPVQRVAHACGSLDEAYRFKLGALAEQDVIGRLDLTEWCLRKELFGYAAKQLRYVGERAPDHPRLGLLMDRLAAALRASSPDEQRAPSRHNSEQHAGRAADAAIPTAAAELDDLAAPAAGITASANATAQFTARIQPLLLNRCASVGCHGGRSASEFQLSRAAASQSPHRGMTQRNLFSVLAYIDPKSPAASPLLQLPAIAGHGGRQTPIFGPTDRAQYEQLEAWVTALVDDAQEPQGAAPLLSSSTTDLQVPIQPPPADDWLPGGLSTVGPVEASESVIDQAGVSVDSTPPVNSRPSLDAVGGELAGIDELPGPHSASTNTLPPAERVNVHQALDRPRDPFDPRIFNRRFFPDRPDPVIQPTGDIDDLPAEPDLPVGDQSSENSPRSSASRN